MSWSISSGQLFLDCVLLSYFCITNCNKYLWPHMISLGQERGATYLNSLCWGLSWDAAIRISTVTVVFWRLGWAWRIGSNMAPHMLGKLGLLLAWGIISPLCGPLHKAAWVSSWHGGWLPLWWSRRAWQKHHFPLWLHLGSHAHHFPNVLEVM